MAEQTPDQVLQQYSDAVTGAKTAWDNTAAKLDFYQKQLDELNSKGPTLDANGNPPLGGDPDKALRDSLQKQVTTLTDQLAKVQNEYIITLRTRADATNKARDSLKTPEERTAYAAKLNAQAEQDKAAADKATSELKEWQSAAPERRAAVVQQQRIQTAQADTAELNTQFQRETDPIKKAALGEQLKQAQLQNAQLQAQTQYAGQNAASAATTASAQADTAKATATTAQAQASLAPQMAQATYDAARNTADRARLEVQQLQAQLNATTDADRRRGISLDLATKQAALDMATQQLESARQLLPISVRQAGLGADATQAGIDKGKLGAGYGLADRIAAWKQRIASGDVTPEQASQGIQQEIRSAASGVTPVEQMSTDTTRRGQDVQLASTRTSDYTSGLGNLLSQFSALARGGARNSTAPGEGFLQAVNLLQQGIDRNSAIAQSPLMQSMTAPTGQPAGALPAPPAASPSPSPAGVPAPAGSGHSIVINIGGGGQAAVDPSVNPQLPRAVQGPAPTDPITPDHAAAANAQLQGIVDKHLARIAGGITGPTAGANTGMEGGVGAPDPMTGGVLAGVGG